jgi:hypothetical protein
MISLYANSVRDHNGQLAKEASLILINLMLT